ncbi:MAG: PDZ domain-containing protein [Epulopiscium sp.]|nr:PDZ domain-containing protein [Candidatus Epulonipiscium sp.]
MQYFLQIVVTSLQSVSLAVFQPWFLLILYLVYWMYKKNYYLALQTALFVKGKIFEKMVQSLLTGILVGIGLSIVLIFLGIPMYFSEQMVFLLPIALVLSLFNFRYLCFSYAGGILGIFYFIARGLKSYGFGLPEIHLDIPGIIALVGILHLMEAWLVFAEGSRDSIPIVIKKDDSYAAAYLMQRYWPIPFSLLIMEFVTSIPQGMIETPEWWPIMKNIITPPNPELSLIYTVLPITAILGYGDIAVSQKPEVKSKKTAVSLMFYSSLLIVIAIMSPERLWLQFLGIFLMPLVHEIMIVGNQRKEKISKPLFTFPKKGVRILELKADGVAEKMGMKRGDIILRINGIEIENYAHMKVVLSNYHTFLWFDVLSADGEEKYFEYKAYPYGINDIGIVPLMEQAVKVFRLEDMENVGLFRILKK